MSDNPDVPGSASSVWERHFLHHMQREHDKADTEKYDLDDIKKQLLKLQLGEARHKVNETKHKDSDEGQIQMVQQAVTTPLVGNTTPDLYPTYYAPQRSYRRVARGMQAGYVQDGRGHGGEWVCWGCGQPGHIRRECAFNPYNN